MTAKIRARFGVYTHIALCETPARVRIRDGLGPSQDKSARVTFKRGLIKSPYLI